MIESIFTTSTILMICLVAFFLLLSLGITLDNRKRMKNTTLKREYLTSYQELENQISPKFREYFGTRYALKRIQKSYEIHQKNLEPIKQIDADTEQTLKTILLVSWKKRIVLRNIAFFLSFTLFFFIIIQTSNMLFASAPTLHVTPDYPFWDTVRLWFSSVSFRYFYTTHIQSSLFIYIIILAFLAFALTPLKRYYGSNIHIQFGIALLSIFAFVYLFLSIGFQSIVIFSSPITFWISVALLVACSIFIIWDRKKIKQDIINSFPMPT